MSWKFWESPKRCDNLLSSVAEQLANITGRLGSLEALLKSSQQQVNNIDGQLTQNFDQLKETGVQVQKLARLYYKTGQDTQGKLDKLMTGMELVRQWQEQYLQESNQLELKEKQLSVLAEAVIKQLDDLDYIGRALKDDIRDNWRQMMEQWAVMLVRALAEADILEIDLLGKSFDPRLAEAIATVSKTEAQKIYYDTGEEILLPYQIVAVTRRGFATPKGHVLRKAQVITVKGDSSNA